MHIECLYAYIAHSCYSFDLNTVGDAGGDDFNRWLWLFAHVSDPEAAAAVCPCACVRADAEVEPCAVRGTGTIT